MLRFLCCVALCGLLPAQTSRPESVPTSRPLAVALPEFAAADARMRAINLASTARLNRLHELVKEMREAWGETLKQRLRDEAARINEEHERTVLSYETTQQDYRRLRAETLAWGAEDVRAWGRTHGAEVPGLPDWRYGDVGTVPVVYEQLGDWIGMRITSACLIYVGPPDRYPTAVRIDWRLDDLFGDPIPGANSTTTLDLPPEARQSIYMTRLVTGVKASCPDEAQAQPEPGVARIVAVRGKGVSAK